MSSTRSTGRASRNSARSLGKSLLVACLLLVPSLAHAQSVAGTVRDASGGVLPGVSVEAASSALIEKTRTATTDSTGQYRITDLVPGTYTLTFTLPSFATVKREGLEISGGAVVSVNIEMRVGGLQETITVSSEAPVVDVQTSTKKQTVLSNEVLETLPSSRGYGNLISTVPGIQQNQVDNGNAQPQTDQNAVATNGLSLNGNYDVTSQQVQAAIGRPLPGGAATQSVNLVLPGALYGPRINTLDFRFAKVLRFGRTQTNVGLDLYNIFNSNTGTSFNQGFGVDGSAYLRPLTILNPRFLRYNVTVDF
jgi:hypothetical protein